jgi:hypothetical protein
LKKIIGIIIASSVLFFAGSIYANVDPASKLSNWYDHSFQKGSERLGAETAVGLFKTVVQVKTILNESREYLESSIVSYTADRVKEVVSEINQISTDNENRIEQTVSDLEKENFDDYAENANIEEELDQSFEEILEDVLTEEESNE